MQAARGEADDRVAGLAARAVDQVVGVDEADAGAGEVELVLFVDAGELGRLAADQHAAGGAADLGCALDELRDLVELDVRGGDVVEQEERRRAGAEHVVDAVRSEIHAAPAQAARAPLQHQLRADAVSRRCEEAPLVERVEPGEMPEALGAGRLDGRAQPLDDRVRGRKRDARGLVGAPVFAHVPLYDPPEMDEPPRGASARAPIRKCHEFVTTCSCLTPGQCPVRPITSLNHAEPAPVSDTAGDARDMSAV